MSRSDCQPEKANAASACEHCLASRPLSRRAVLKSALGMGLSLQFIGLAAHAQEEVKKARPQMGDVLVFSLGDRQGQPISVQDVPLGGPPLFAYAMDPATQTVRDGSRLNRVLVVRLTEQELSDQSRTSAAEGIVGYSAVCTHTGCDVVGWNNDAKYLVCPCHASTFDPKDRAKVVSGPAPRPLAALPLRVVGGKVTVAGTFSGRVGAEQK